MAKGPPSTAGIVTVCDRYKVGRELGQGSFGVLHKGVDPKTEEPVAIKFEAKSIPHPQLPLEYKFYKTLKGVNGIPKLYKFADVPDTDCQVLVMELLGPSLDGLFAKCQRKFTIKTVLQLAIRMIILISSVHRKGIIHRDIKPDNYLMGLKGSLKEKTLHLVDFGLAKFYKEETENNDSEEAPKHIERGKSTMLIGTVRYCSINAQKYKVLSRRDDLEAIGYVLVYLAKGRLPWQGQTGAPAERNAKILTIKKETTIQKLCDELPSSFEDYFKIVRKLSFKEDPDYNQLVELFKAGFLEQGFDLDDCNDYDWDKL